MQTGCAWLQYDICLSALAKAKTEERRMCTHCINGSQRLLIGFDVHHTRLERPGSIPKNLLAFRKPRLQFVHIYKRHRYLTRLREILMHDGPIPSSAEIIHLRGQLGKRLPLRGTSQTS